MHKLLIISLSLFILGCSMEKEKETFTGAKGEVKLITLDPGHFHAALVQKTMYPQVDPVVHVYAPEGPDVEDHLQRIEAFNHRTENPTTWQEKVAAPKLSSYLKPLDGLAIAINKIKLRLKFKF